MRKISLFIAMSLDGYIADVHGAVDWLQGQEPGSDDMMSYHEFIKDIDTVVMGWNTYHQLMHELCPEDWPYKDFNTIVLTHRKQTDTPNIKFINEAVCEVVYRLRQKEGKGIWICGGPSIIRPLIKEQMLDIMILNIIPMILGNGIPLFEKTENFMPLKLLYSRSYNGITDLAYAFRHRKR